MSLEAMTSTYEYLGIEVKWYTWLELTCQFVINAHCVWVVFALKFVNVVYLLIRNSGLVN